MSETTPETTPDPKTFFLRDRLYSTLTEYEAKEPYAAVEAVCSQVSGWLRAQADEWHGQAAQEGDVMGVAKAAAILCQGLADGIDRGAPQQGEAPSGTEVPPKDSGVSSDS